MIIRCPKCELEFESESLNPPSPCPHCGYQIGKPLDMGEVSWEGGWTCVKGKTLQSVMDEILAEEDARWGPKEGRER